jgi:hypothetical protein
MAIPLRKCQGQNGDCGRDVYALGYCIAHYRRFKSGGDVDKPIRDREKNEVQLTPPRVAPQIKAAIKAVCEQAELSEYEFMRRLVTDWFEQYNRTFPGVARAAKAPKSNGHDGKGAR